MPKMSNFINRSLNRSGRKSNVSANNNTIYEEDSPVKTRNRLNNTIGSVPTKSSHSKFQRNNSNPFPKAVSRAAPVVHETPKKIDDSRQQKSLGKLLKYITPNSKKKKNQSKHDRSFKVYDELNISSKASPPPKVNQVYEKSINLHGDVVEYAVPYNDVEPPIINDSTGCGSVTSDNMLDDSWNDGLLDISALVSPIKITDLDKSSCDYRSLIQTGKTNESTKVDNMITLTSNFYLHSR